MVEENVSINNNKVDEYGLKDYLLYKSKFNANMIDRTDTEDEIDDFLRMILIRFNKLNKKDQLSVLLHDISIGHSEAADRVIDAMNEEESMNESKVMEIKNLKGWMLKGIIFFGGSVIVTGVIAYLIHSKRTDVFELITSVLENLKILFEIINIAGGKGE